MNNVENNKHIILVFSDFGDLGDFSKAFKMSATEELSKIKGKSVDAIGHLTFYIDFEQLRSPFRIEKIFGLINMKTNVVFKFKLVVTEDRPENMKLELTYVSEESIDCKIKIGNHPPELFEHLNISDKVKFFNCTKRNPAMFQRVCFDISVLVITTTSINNVFARMFNNQSTSDFTVKCQDKQFYVHQRILRERSEYFEAILHNDCIEKRNNMLKIDDFQPNMVEIFLRYLYNGALSTPGSLSDMICLMKMADKYNAKDLFDAMDSQISQECVTFLNIIDIKKKHILLKCYLKEFEGIQAPKFTAMIYKWKSTEKGSTCLDDSKWSSLIRENPNFAMLGGIIIGRNDYQKWFEQHNSWCLWGTLLSGGRNDFAVLVGPIGEIKGAVKCSLV